MAKGNMMSEDLKREIARQLGVQDKVQSQGWGAVSSRECGSMVREAIRIAERQVNAR